MSTQNPPVELPIATIPSGHDSGLPGGSSLYSGSFFRASAARSIWGSTTVNVASVFPMGVVTSTVNGPSGTA